MKIGLVTPYIYPLPGGVNQHVRYLYENLRLRGHDVRIISSSHGLQRASEGDIIRIGKGFSLPVNGSVGTITLSPRFVSQVRAMLEREQFDLLHFHEPFVPFLSPIILRLSTSVNIARSPRAVLSKSVCTTNGAACAARPRSARDAVAFIVPDGRVTPWPSVPPASTLKPKNASVIKSMRPMFPVPKSNGRFVSQR